MQSFYYKYLASNINIYWSLITIKSMFYACSVMHTSFSKKQLSM